MTKKSSTQDLNKRASHAWLAEVELAEIPVTAEAPILVKYQKDNVNIPGPQRHNCFELNYQFQGTTHQYLGQDQRVRGPGVMQLLRPQVPHMAMRQQGGPHETAVVYFLPSAVLEAGGGAGDSAGLFRLFSNPHTAGDVLLQLKKADKKPVEGWLRTMIREAEEPTFGSSLILRACLIRLLVTLARSAESREDNSGAGSVDWQRLEKALAFLHAKYQDKLYAEDIARAVGVSQTSLKKIFREGIGMPWGQYLQSYRIHQACVLLQEGLMNITQIATDTGFQDLSYFIRSFREKTGLTPSEYRRLNRSPAETSAEDE